MKNGWKEFAGGYFRLAAVLFVAITAVTVVAADWPCYRGNAQRDAISPEQLVWPLQLLWTHTPAQAPAPAWPEPGWEAHRINFDYTFHTAVAGGLVFFGSSADDTVCALDLKTGRQKWRFTTGAPVRFAPHVADGRCYFASDDGFAYCVDAATGALVWQFRAALDERRLPGNERMISRWPCRTGVLVADGVVYVTAGMWPAEGVYVYALDPATGKQIWCNDTSGSGYTMAAHSGAWTMGRVAPQGYLLAKDDNLIVPTGRFWPALFDRRDGKLRFYASGQQFGGSAAVTIIGNMAWSGGTWASGGEAARIGDVGKLLTVRSLMIGLNLKNPKAKGGWHDELYGMQMGVGEYFQFAGWATRPGGPSVTRWRPGPTWRVPTPYVYASAVAGKQLLLGCEGKVLALACASGKEAGSVAVAGLARGIAVADGRLLVSTDKGAIQCFGPSSEQPAPETSTARRSGAPPISPQAAELLKRIKGAGLADKGYALVLGAPDAGLAEALARSTRMTVIAGLADKAKVQSERERLLDAGIYGARVSVQHIEDFGHLPFVQFFANLVVVSGAPAGLSGAELYRILAPCHGVLMFEGAGAGAAEQLISSAGIPSAEVRRTGGVVEVRRGKLAGAFDWNSKVSSDQRLKWPLELLWFGGPGPDRMWERHLPEPTTPVPANGRYFAKGQRHVIAVDAYNGTELWAREMGTDRSMQLLADDDTVYIKKDIYLALDARSGELKKVFGQPRPQQRFTLDKPQKFTLKAVKGKQGARIAPRLDATPNEATLKIACILEMRKTRDGLECELTTRDGKSTGWWLSFDFRPAAERTWFFGPKTFQYYVSISAKGNPYTKQYVIEAMDNSPEVSLKQGDGGSIVFTLPWEELRRVLGGDPADFTFGACAMFGSAGGICPEFAPGYGGAVNEGWARFILDPSRAGEAPEIFKVPVGKLADVPNIGVKPSYWIEPRLPPRTPKAIKASRPEALSQRTTLTGESAPIIWRRSHSCGGNIFSATMDFTRSGSHGFYDLEDDSGMRNFAAIRPSCGIPAMPALGIVIYSEGSAGCGCSYNFQTSAAMAPAAKRRNEDWALYLENLKPGASFKRLAVNFGAPGDRRDDQRVLWLGYPRQVQKNYPQGGASPLPLTVDLPVKVDGSTNMAAWHFNADRTEVKGTDRPWIYASGYRGLKQIKVNLRFSGTGSNAAALPPAGAASAHTVRLHFAEPDEIKAGRRVFDVSAQGKAVLSGLDVAKEAGGARRALTKEIRGVPLSDALTLEFVSKTGGTTDADSPILCGLEIIKE